jgi:response regulator RpfG family c-di-GMP phosphodiesterase
MENQILLVDDDKNILEAYKRSLRKQFQLSTASGGREALNMIDNEGPFAVVVSDMRMPEMDGVQFLMQLREKAPDTVRMMLTGNADQQTAIDAVNKGDIFKFLTKPCAPELIQNALQSGIEQYRLIRAERELLEHTVRGGVSALVEVLALARPLVFGRATRVKNLVIACAEELGVEADWQLETTALLSLIGTISLTDDIVEKALSGAPLQEHEREQFRQYPQLGKALIGKIPRMEAVAEGIGLQLKNFDGSGYPKNEIKGEDIPLAARLVKVILRYDALDQLGHSPSTAMGYLSNHLDMYDPEIINALSQVVSKGQKSEVFETELNLVTDELFLAEDVITVDGTLLVCKGQRLTESVQNRLLNFSENQKIHDKVLVTKLATQG